MKIVFELPKLYAKASTGKIKEWKGQVELIDKVPHIVKIHGYANGKKQTSKKAIKEGKNIGRANETTPVEQAIMDITSRWNLKKDETYMEDVTKLDNKKDIILPMLAMNYSKRKHDILYPCMVQPKLNGVRCIYQDDKFISRKGKEYSTLDHLRPHLKKLCKTVKIPDGEIFTRDFTFQEILRAVKKERDTTKKLEYWIYDQVDSNKSFDDRNIGILKAFEKHGKIDREGIRRIGPLVYVNTYERHNEDEVMVRHKEFTRQGYEGTIIRNLEGIYKDDLKRSSNLQKYKDFIDDEFEIIGFKLSTGNEDGCVVFTCKTKDDAEFAVRPRGSREIRREWAADMDNILGKELTVRYQELSDDGVPIFPVGICVRDYE